MKARRRPQNNEQRLHTCLGVIRAFVTTISYTGKLHAPRYAKIVKITFAGVRKSVSPQSSKIKQIMEWRDGRPSNPFPATDRGWKPRPNK